MLTNEIINILVNSLTFVIFTSFQDTEFDFLLIVLVNNFILIN